MNKRKVVKAFSDTICALEIESELNISTDILAEYLFKQLEILPSVCRGQTNYLPLPIPEVHKEEQNSSVNEFVDRMYDLYPSKCPKRNASTGKSRKDKDRIKRLLKVYTEEQIEQVIRAEVDNNLGVNYMKNFSTFLNNFPEPLTEAPRVESKKEEPFILNGIRYQ